MDELLKILESDARTSIETLARLTGRTETAVREAIADYEARGVIKHYSTVIDWDRVGVERVLAFIDVKVTPARDVGFDDVAERIYRFDDVLSLWLVSGEYDMRLLVQGRNVLDVGMFVAQKLSTLDRVTGTSTHFLLKRYKESRVVFVDDEAEDPRLSVAP